MVSTRAKGSGGRKDESVSPRVEKNWVRQGNISPRAVTPAKNVAAEDPESGGTRRSKRLRTEEPVKEENLAEALATTTGRRGRPPRSMGSTVASASDTTGKAQDVSMKLPGRAKAQAANDVHLDQSLRGEQDRDKQDLANSEAESREIVANGSADGTALDRRAGEALNEAGLTSGILTLGMIDELQKLRQEYISRRADHHDQRSSEQIPLSFYERALPILNSLSNEILRVHAVSSFSQICAISSGMAKQLSTEYASIQDALNTCHQLFTEPLHGFDDWRHHSSVLEQAASKVHQANVAVFITSMFGSQRMSFYQLDAAFWNTVITGEQQIPHDFAQMYLDLKVQAFISAMGDMVAAGISKPLDIADDFFPKSGQCLPKSPSVAANKLYNEPGFVDRVAKLRQQMLIAATRSNSVQYLQAIHPWSVFLQSFHRFYRKYHEDIAAISFMRHGNTHEDDDSYETLPRRPPTGASHTKRFVPRVNHSPDTPETSTSPEDAHLRINPLPYTQGNQSQTDDADPDPELKAGLQKIAEDLMSSAEGQDAVSSSTANYDFPAQQDLPTYTGQPQQSPGKPHPNAFNQANFTPHQYHRPGGHIPGNTPDGKFDPKWVPPGAPPPPPGFMYSAQHQSGMYQDPPIANPPPGQGQQFAPLPGQVPVALQSAPTHELYQRARSTHTSRTAPSQRRSGQTPSARRPWSHEEEEALMQGLDIVQGPHWSAILSLHGPNGTVSKALAHRNQVQLKDKARNLKLFFLKTGAEIPYYLSTVTGDLKARAPSSRPSTGGPPAQARGPSSTTSLHPHQQLPQATSATPLRGISSVPMAPTSTDGQRAHNFETDPQIDPALFATSGDSNDTVAMSAANAAASAILALTGGEKAHDEQHHDQALD